ncbi:MAG: polysaccharide deacetylase family protein, partial [Cyanobacteriota bacterium]|nr:polysaccharide deacetylase family protein [Cyanobacteriota bacterium]
MRINFGRFYASLTLMLSLGVAFPLMTLPSFADTKPSTESQTCENPDLLEAEISTDQFSKVFNWLVNPEMVLADLIQTVGYQMIVEANTRPSPWPTIHDRARLARVPVMMYHDILPKKKVSFDLTIKQFKGHLEAIKENGLTPISLDQLTRHLQTGESLPKNPIVLTFDDGYIGHYEVVYPLLKEYNYPGAFSIYTDKVDGKIVGRSTVT